MESLLSGCIPHLESYSLACALNHELRHEVHSESRLAVLAEGAVDESEE